MPKAILVVSVIVLGLSVFAALVFVFLPALFVPDAYLQRLILGCLVVLLIWLSVRIIQGGRLAWYVGAVVYAPFALFALIGLGMYAVQLVSPPDEQDALPFAASVFWGLNVTAFMMLYTHRGVRRLFGKAPPIVTAEELATDGDGPGSEPAGDHGIESG